MGACTLDPPKGIQTPVVEPTPRPLPTTKEALSDKSEKVKQNRLVVEVREKGLSGGRLQLSIVGAPKSLNPIIANESVSNRVLNTIFSTCFSFDYREQELRPSLCKMVNQNEAGTQFTYTLRKGLKWSDGKALTTSDIEFSYAVISDQKIAASTRDLFLQEQDKRSKPYLPRLEIVDQHRFRFHLERANQQFHLIASTMPIIPKHQWLESYTNGKLSLDSVPSAVALPLVGSGPFFLSQYDDGNRLALKRNPYFWKQDQHGQQLPYLTSIDIHMHRDFLMSLVRFSEGETHLHDVKAAEYNRLMRKRQQGQWQIIDLGPSHSTNYLMFNLDKTSFRAKKGSAEYRRKWFRNPHFRRAISHAIDREGIIRNVLWGRGQPLWSYNSPADRRWSTDKVTHYPFDLLAAEKELKQAGFVKKGQQLFDGRGVPVRFSVLTNAENGARVAMLQIIKKNVERLGINVDVRPMPFVKLLDHFKGERMFDAILLGWGADVPSDPMFSKNVLFSAGQDHLWSPSQKRPHTKWEAKVDQLLRKNLASQHYETRKPLLDEILIILSQHLPQIPLVVEYLAAAADVKVGNFEPYALDGGLYWNLEQLFLRAN
jgi:peptide/nickel transport system substrate-binding protein